MPATFRDRLASSRPLILDGGTGTELSRRGIDLNSAGWTAGVIRQNPRLLQEIHRDYVNAGAELVTANTFRTHARSLRGLGLEAEAGALTREAVQIARRAAAGRAFVAGSVAPVEDCYSPQLKTAQKELRAAHRLMAQDLAEAGVDVILIETQVTIEEATIAAEAARETGLPFCVSFVCDRQGRVLSGENLLQAYRSVAPMEPAALLVNCLPVSEVLPTLDPVRSEFPEIPFGAYANTGRLLANGTWEATDGELPAVYAGYARAWIDSGLQLVGGCCGTTPDHISAILQIV